MRHRLNIRTEVQFPASLDNSLEEVEASLAARRLRTESPSRFDSGAATVVSPLLTAKLEESTSAPAALKKVSASTSFSGDPGSLWNS